MGLQGSEKILGVESGDLFVREYPFKNQGGVVVVEVYFLMKTRRDSCGVGVHACRVRDYVKSFAHARTLQL